LSFRVGVDQIAVLLVAVAAQIALTAVTTVAVEVLFRVVNGNQIGTVDWLFVVIDFVEILGIIVVQVMHANVVQISRVSHVTLADGRAKSVLLTTTANKKIFKSKYFSYRRRLKSSFLPLFLVICS
jgi:hypothetical protein